MAGLVSELFARDCLVGSDAAALSVEHQDNVLVEIAIDVVRDLEGVGSACVGVDVVRTRLVKGGEIASCDLGLGSRVVSSIGKFALPDDLSCLCIYDVVVFFVAFSLYKNGLRVICPVTCLVDGNVEVRGESLDRRSLCI